MAEVDLLLRPHPYTLLWNLLSVVKSMKGSFVIYCSPLLLLGPLASTSGLSPKSQVNELYRE